METYLQPTYFLDANTLRIREFASETVAGAEDERTKAVRLYYRVRDEILYDPYDLRHDRQAMRASSVLSKGRGYCVSKAVLLAALARAAGIPSRLGFADVTNHLSTPRLRSLMQTDLFVFHGYTELFLEGSWVKATPAFNLSLCERFGVRPLEFDGTADSIFHPFDIHGRKHMEYVRDHGTFADLPFDLIFRAYGETYPNFFDTFGRGSLGGSFEREAKNRPLSPDET